MTLNPLSASISRTVKTVSYSIEFPTFFVESVFVATWKYQLRLLYLSRQTGSEPGLECRSFPLKL